MLTNFTNINVSSGDQTLAEITASDNDFVTILAKFTDIDQDLKIKVEQTLDEINWSDIAFPGSSELGFIILRSGTKALNAIGLNCVKIRIKIVVGKATLGLIDKITVLT